MTKQEGIKKAIKKLTDAALVEEADSLGLTNDILGCLHSLKVVIKVERKPSIDKGMLESVAKEIMARVPDVYVDDQSFHYTLESLI